MKLKKTKSSRKSRSNKCETFNCRNSRGKQRRLCYSCTKKKYADKNPVKYAYQVLRGNAKRRGHKFTITLQEFIRFCVKTKILMGRGRTKDCYSIDRIDESKGYEPGNMQILTVSENRLKYTKHVKYDWETRHGSTVKVFESKEDLPF